MTPSTQESLKRPSRQSLADSIYEILLARLVEGEIKAGSPVNIDSLARELVVSPTPLREALARLEATGLVVREALRGYRAAPLFTREQLVRLMDARSVIEPSCAVYACHNSDEDFLAELTANVAVMSRIVDEGEATSYERYREVDERFHDLIAQQSDNEFLFRAYKSLEAHVQRFRLFGALGSSDIRHAIREHTAIIEALGSGSPEQAGEVMAAHIDGVRTRAIQDRDTVSTS